jgi:hypothetical protein
MCPVWREAGAGPAHGPRMEGADAVDERRKLRIAAVEQRIAELEQEIADNIEFIAAINNVSKDEAARLLLEP